ncbi:MAG: hypothetical protein AAF711_13215 [Planctomycetota bacterium]
MAEEQKDAKYWLDQSITHAKAWVKTPDRDPADDEQIYDLPELVYRLAIYYAAIDEQALAEEALTVLAGTVELIILAEESEDLWPRTFLPGPMLAVGKELTLTLPEDPSNQAFTKQIIAEAHFALGDRAAYQRACDEAFALLKPGQDADLADAKEYGYVYASSVLSWHLMRMCRDNKDLVNARKFARFAWHDGCERAGVLAMLAQMEWSAGNEDTARELVSESVTLMKRAVQHHHEERAKHADKPEEELWDVLYDPDLDNFLPELYTAIHLTTDAEQAERMCKALALEDTYWRVPAYIHSATMLRRAGEDMDQASAMVTKAYTTLVNDGETPWAYDTMHLGRELAKQGKNNLITAFQKQFDGEHAKAFFTLGIAQARLSDKP